ncbi:MAG: DUF4249 family protein [Bacteroidota bacterium]
MRSIYKNSLWALLVLAVGACNLEQEIDLELPVYESQLVVESYLQPGEPFTLLLTQSAGYFDPFPTENDEFLEQILVDDAGVAILHNGNRYELENGLFFNPFTLQVFNYGSTETMPEDFDNDFELEIITSGGQTATATTRLLAPIGLDSIIFDGNNTADSSVTALTYFEDEFRESDNFYRFMIHRATLDSLYSDFVFSDRVVETSTIVVGTAPDFEVGDTLINTLIHITPEYYDFYNSVQGAIFSNGNPFAQPGGIISNIEGDANATGIFTTLQIDRVTSIVE